MELLEDTHYFDVSHHFDARYEGSTTNPFAGLSTSPGTMMPFQRDDMEARLRLCIQAANRAHWSLSKTDGVGANVDPTTLREPTPEETKALKLNADVAKWCDEAAHIRAYLAHLDRETAKREKEERRQKRDALKRKATLDPAAVAQLRKLIAGNEAGAARHKRRVEDEEAFKMVIFAQNELEAMERKAAIAKRELEAMR